MNDYILRKCPRYTIDIRDNGIVDFIILINDNINIYSINLIKENMWKGRERYSFPHPERHFICHDDGDLVITSYNYTRMEEKQ